MSPERYLSTPRRSGSLARASSSLRTRCRSQSGVAGARYGWSQPRRAAGRPALHGAPGDTARVGKGRKRREGGIPRHGDPFPDSPADGTPRGRAGAAHVVRIAVGHRQDVEPPNAKVPERRRDNPFAYVEPGGPTETARVDQQRPARRQLNERRVALSHVQHTHSQPRLVRPGLQRRRSDSRRSWPTSAPPPVAPRGATGSSRAPTHARSRAPRARSSRAQ